MIRVSADQRYCVWFSEPRHRCCINQVNVLVNLWVQLVRISRPTQKSPMCHVSEHTQMHLWTFLYILIALPGEKSVLFHSEKFSGGGWWHCNYRVSSWSRPWDLRWRWYWDDLYRTWTWPEHDLDMTWTWPGHGLDLSLTIKDLD